MSRSICIAHGGDISNPSGPRVIAFVKALYKNGFDVHLVVPKPKKESAKDLQGINVHTVPIKSGSVKNQIFRALLVSLKAKKVAKKESAILELEHSTLAGFASLVGCRDFVLDMHDLAFMSPLYANLPFSNLVRRFIYKMEKKAVNRASKIIVVSKPMRDFIVNEWGVEERKIELIPNGYFEGEHKVSNFDVIEEVQGMIGFLGTLHAKLDVDKIVRLAKSGEDLNIYIIGDGPARNELETKISKYSLKNIMLTGWLPYREALELAAKSQVLILPEHYSLLTEVSCPTKLFDYAALSRAIAADDVSELCREFKENNAALVSDPANAEEFIKNVHRLLDDRELRKELGNNARRLVKDFTWEKQGEKLVKMYRKTEENNER